MSPAALGNGTLPRGPLHIPEGDDSCDPCLPPNCTLRCPRLPVSPPSLIIHAGKYCRIRVNCAIRIERRLPPNGINDLCRGNGTGVGLAPLRAVTNSGHQWITWLPGLRRVCSMARIVFSS